MAYASDQLSDGALHPTAPAAAAAHQYNWPRWQEAWESDLLRAKRVSRRTYFNGLLVLGLLGFS